MEPLSIDLRERVVTAVDAGQTYAATAERFAVSVTSVGRLVRLRDRAGSVAAKPYAGGFPGRVDPAARDALRALVRARPDATLAELRDRLSARPEGAVAVSASRVCQVLAELGLPRKRSRRPRPSGTART